MLESIEESLWRVGVTWQDRGHGLAQAHVPIKWVQHKLGEQEGRKRALERPTDRFW